MVLSAIDQQGITITIVGYLIVMASLILLSVIFSSIPKVISYFTIRKLRSQGKKLKGNEGQPVAGDVNAAIATALHLYFSELHDEESNVITIKKIAKRYTPWSSKIYNMNSYNNRYRH